MRYIKRYENFNIDATNELLHLLMDDIVYQWRHYSSYHEKPYKKISIDKVKQLLDNGANINVHDDVNNYGSLLHLAILRDDVKLVKFLVEKGVDVNSTNSVNSTTIYYASAMNLEILKILVENGGDVNIGNDSGVLPIQYACSNNKFENATYLLKSGSKVRYISEWIKNKNYKFQDLLFQMYPEEAILISPQKLHPDVYKKYEYLYSALKYNL